jgi:phosphatidylinositol alpha-1,6-mannosyltransferase
LLLTAARLVRRKGIDTVLNALPLVVRQAPQVQYAIVGSGPERDPLEALSNELGMRDRVHFLGHLEDREVVIAYNECYAFVMPARYEHPSVEGFGLVFREANACGKPVVGARTGGVPDAIEHETTGLLVEPDDPSELSQALLRLLDNPSFARDLGQQGRRLVESSGTWEHATVAMLNFMQGSISQGATA